jgi:hypothetical protein
MKKVRIAHCTFRSATFLPPVMQATVRKERGGAISRMEKLCGKRDRVMAADRSRNIHFVMQSVVHHE